MDCQDDLLYERPQHDPHAQREGCNDDQHGLNRALPAHGTSTTQSASPSAVRQHQKMMHRSDQQHVWQQGHNTLRHVLSH